MTPWRTLARAAWPYAIPLVILVLGWPLLSPRPAIGEHFQFWAAGHIVVTGGSPYDRAAWETLAAVGPIPDGAAVNTIPLNLRLTRDFWLYPPQTAFLFAPFGLFPVAVGVPLVHLFVFAVAVIGVVLAAAALGLRGTRLAFVLALTAVSEPFVISVRDGHPDGLVLAGLACLFVGARDRRMWLLAAGVALVSIKPHLVIAFAVLLVGYLFARGERRAIAVAAATALLVILPAEIHDPFPFAALLGATDQRIGLDLSTTGALTRDLGDGAALTGAIALGAIAAAALAFRLAAVRPPVAFGAASALTLVVSPYVHHYDQILVLPAAFAALAVGVRARTELLIVSIVAALIAVVPWVLFYWWPVLAGQGDRRYQGGALGALPVLAVFVLVLAVAVSAHRDASDWLQRPARLVGR